jgi:uncharacterized cupredoxin-like copper-binding protein
MKKKFFGSILATLMVLQAFFFVSAASAASVEVTIKPGESYEFVVINTAAAIYPVHFQPVPAVNGQFVDLLALDKYGKTILQRDKVYAGTSVSVYAEGRTTITNSGNGDYLLTYETANIAGQKVGAYNSVTVEQTGSAVIKPGDTYKATYTAQESASGIDVAIDNPGQSTINYQVTDANGTTAGSSTGYFPVKVPQAGNVEFTNNGTTDVTLNYFTHWITISKLEKVAPLAPVASKYTIVAVAPGETFKVTNIYIAYNFTIDAQGGKFNMATYNSAGQALTPQQEYVPTYAYTVTTKLGDYAIIQNTGNGVDPLIINANNNYLKVEQQ